MDNLLWSLLGGVLFPLWLIAGLVDFWTHQRTDIAHNSGLPESLLHFAQTVQVGIPLLVVLFLQVNFLALAIIVACVTAHTLTAYIDLRYTSGRRDIPPVEQIAHGLLLTLPVFATMLIVVLHWGDLATGTVAPWAMTLRVPPWPLEIVLLVLISSVLFGLLPGLAELRQTAAAAKAQSNG